MDILFSSTKLAKILNSTKELRKCYGADCGGRIGRRLDDLRAADNLAVIRKLSQMRCHELTGDRKGQLAADVNGGLDWENVRTIRILEVIDYHG